MLPGISTEDCLVADLGVDLSQSGYQCYEASNFLSLRQASRYGCRADFMADRSNRAGEVWSGSGRRAVHILTERLLAFYPADHQVAIYEAATLPVCDTCVRKTVLAEPSKLSGQSHLDSLRPTRSRVSP